MKISDGKEKKYWMLFVWTSAVLLLAGVSLHTDFLAVMSKSACER